MKTWRSRYWDFLVNSVSRGQYDLFDRPIFIIAPPRSGSTFLFELVIGHADVHHPKNEVDSIWWQVFPYSLRPDWSDRVGREDISHETIARIRKLTFLAAMNGRLKQPSLASRQARTLWQSLAKKRIRLLDKTIANCFHLEFLAVAFPDANYVFLTRDPRDNISSMLEAWPHYDLVGKPQLDPIVQREQDRTVDHWSFPAPPGWQAILRRPLPEICAWSWKQHVDSALGFFDGNQPACVEVKYEELIEDPSATLKRLASRLDLKLQGNLTRTKLGSRLSRTTISAPSQGKWREKYPDEIAAVVPLIRATAYRIGYELSE